MHYNIKPIKLECELIFPNGLLLQPFYQTRGVQFKALLQLLQECNYSANSIKMMTWGNINHVLALPPPQTLDPQVSSNLFSKIQQSRKNFFKPMFFSKKRMNEFDFTAMIPHVDLYFSLVFWKKSKTTKRHFEIN